MSRFVQDDPATGRQGLFLLAFGTICAVWGMVFITVLRVWDRVPAPAPVAIRCHFYCDQCHFNPVPKTYREFMLAKARRAA